MDGDGCVCVCVGVCICVLGWEGGAAQLKGFELLRTYEDDFDEHRTPEWIQNQFQNRSRMHSMFHVLFVT